MVKVISVCQTISGPLMSVNAVKVNLVLRGGSHERVLLGSGGGAAPGGVGRGGRHHRGAFSWGPGPSGTKWYNYIRN